jgi:hypothetical protein
MPTVRTPIKRAARKLVTDQAKEVFARAVALRVVYQNCVRGEGCFSTSPGEHCAKCAEFLDLSSDLSRLLGLRPWQVSPLDCDSETPPDYMRASSLQSKDWREARTLRRELQK